MPASRAWLEDLWAHTVWIEHHSCVCQTYSDTVSFRNHTRSRGAKGALLHCWRECKLATVENNTEVPQKAKNRITIWSSNPTPGHLSRHILVQKDTRTLMFIAALFATAKTWKQPKYPLTDEWTKKILYIDRYNGIILSHKREK